VLGNAINSDRLTIWDETRITALVGKTDDSVGAALLRDLRTNDDVTVCAKVILHAMSRLSAPLRYCGTVTSDPRCSIITSANSR